MLPQHDPGVPLQAMEQSTTSCRLPAPPYMVPGDPSQALEQSLIPCRLPVLPFLVSGDPSQALEQSSTSTSYRLPVLPYMELEAFHLEELGAAPPSLRNALHHHGRGEVLVILRRSETQKPVKKEF